MGRGGWLSGNVGLRQGKPHSVTHAKKPHGGSTRGDSAGEKCGSRAQLGHRSQELMQGQVEITLSTGPGFRALCAPSVQ